MIKCFHSGPLLKLTQYRQRHRRTLDGRLCAAAFTRDGQVFTDCTTIASDDGTTGREWCYVEAQLQGQGLKNWDYCRPSVDYDYVRAVAMEALRVKTADAERMTAKLGDEGSKLQEVLKLYENACGAELEGLMSRVKAMEVMLEHAEHALDNAEEADRSIHDLSVSLETMEAQLRQETLASLRSPYNCRAVEGYEDENEADGITGTYFPSPFLTPLGGQPFIRTDRMIDFVWNSRSPAPGIPHQAFSVRWDGYLQVPEKGEYSLILETACGGRVYVNKQLVLNDRMPEDPYVEAGPSPVYTETQILPPAGLAGPQVTRSQPIYIERRVSIRIEMIHSTHLLWKNEETSLIKLSWVAGSNPEHAQVIPSTAFFTSNDYPTLKLSRLDPSWTDVVTLYPGRQPFLDRQDIYIGDLPVQFEGAKLIRMSSATQQIGVDSSDGAKPPKMKLEINIPARLFVSHEQGTQVPLLSCSDTAVTFKPSDSQLSLFESESANVRARAAVVHTIEEASLLKPDTYVFQPQPSLHPWTMFIRALPFEDSGCVGPVYVVSDPNGPAFDHCSSSSELSSEYSCQYGFNRRNRDEPYSTWKTGHPESGGSGSSSGSGEYVEVHFRHLVRVQQIRFRPLSEPLQWPSELLVSFSQGLEVEEERLTLIYSNDPELILYDLIPKTTKYMRITISEMYAPGETSGGSFEIYGSDCLDLSSVSQPSTSLPPPLFSASCAATTSNIEDFPKLRPGLVVDLQCPTDCAQGEVTAVFGTGMYSGDSSLCLAAKHSGFCADKKCTVTATFSSGQAFYKGSLRNDILSGDHGPNDISFSLQPKVSLLSSPEFSPSHEREEYIVLFHSPQPPPPIVLPSRVVLDDGSVFGSQIRKNLLFGWLRPATPSEQCAETGGLDPLASYIATGGIQFPLPPDRPECMSEDCSLNSWTIKLKPSSKVDLTVQLGSDCVQTGSVDLQVNGQSAASHIKLLPSSSYFITKPDLILSDSGKLTLTSICQRPCPPNTKTIIRSIKIVIKQ